MLKRIFALTGFKVALFITLLVLLTFMFNTVLQRASFLDLMDKKWVDYILRERAVQPHSDNVVIAAIDKDSINAYGRWPWSRSMIARLVHELNDYYKVGTIGFDIVFSEPEESSGLKVTEDYLKRLKALNPGGNTRQFVSYLERSAQDLDADTLLGQELTRKKDVILGYFFRSEKDTEDTQKIAAKQDQARRIVGSEISVLQGTLLKGTVPQGLSVEANIEKINKGGYASGFFNVTPDPEDGTVRRVHVLYQYGENLYPSLDLQMLKHYLNVDHIAVATDETGYIKSITLGQKVVTPDFDGSIMLNYKGPSRTFTHIPVVKILEHKIPKEAMRDKIVLVGATEVGIFDLRNAPVEATYPGVEVHATLLDNVLTNTYFRIDFVNHALTVLLILGLGLLLAFTLPHLQSIYGTVLAIALLIVYALAHRWMVNNLLTWTSFVYVALTLIATWGGVTLFRFLVTDRDKRFIKGAFQQYLAPEVINQLMENPDLLKLGGEREEVTAFFSDVKGFSTISEKLEPEALVHLMQEYLTEMSNIIMKHGGTIDKYIGDAIVAFFGAPVHYDDHAQRACLVSLEMQARLEEMRQAWRTAGKAEDMMLYQRIGLNSGPIVVGNMGSESRFNYTMMGNAVNLAARLEGANKFYGTMTMCSEFTYGPSKDVVVGRELDLLAVKGIKQPVHVFEIMGKRGDVPEDKMKGIAYFEKGLELYRKMQWDEATKYFQAVFKFMPNDSASKVFIERCEEFKAEPPEGEWDGSYVATEK